MRALKWILPVLVLGGAIFGFLSLKNSKPELPAQVSEERAWSVSALIAEPASIAPQIELYAEIENPSEVNLTAALAADVNEVLIREGSRFNAGDLLILLDTEEIDLEIAQQEAQLNSLRAQLESEQVQYQTDQRALDIEREMIRIAERSLDRQRDLSNRNLSSRENLDTAEMNVQQRYLNLISREQSIANHPNRVAQLRASIDQAEAQLARLTLDRERAAVYAPFNGRVSGLNVAVGDRTRSGDPLAQIYPERALELRAQLPLRVLPLIKQAENPAQLMAEALIDGETVKLEFARLGAQVASGGAGIDGLFRFADEQTYYEPGRTLSIRLNLPPQPNLVALPPSALYGTDRVYKVVDSRLQAVQVTHLGDRTDAEGNPFVLIQSDQISAGDQLITTQLPNAVSGIRVEVVE